MEIVLQIFDCTASDGWNITELYHVAYGTQDSKNAVSDKVNVIYLVKFID